MPFSSHTLEHPIQGSVLDCPRKLMFPFIGIILVLLRIQSCNWPEERDTKYIALKGEPIFGVRHEGHSFTRVHILPIPSQTKFNMEVHTTHLMPENFKFGRVPGSVLTGRSFSCISYVALSLWVLKVIWLMQSEYKKEGGVDHTYTSKFCNVHALLGRWR